MSLLETRYEYILIGDDKVPLALPVQTVEVASSRQEKFISKK